LNFVAVFKRTGLKTFGANAPNLLFDIRMQGKYKYNFNNLLNLRVAR